MASPRLQLTEVFQELKRRRVIRVGIVYVVVAWAALQAADVLVPALRLPEWVTTLVALLAILGFPASIALAWAFDLTPEGLKRTTAQESAGGDPARPPAESVRARPARALWVGAVALFVLAAGAGWLVFRRSSADAAGGAVNQSLFAVLPFRVTGADPSLAYLREGIVDLLSVKLTGTRRAVEPRTLLDAVRRAGGGETDLPLDAVVQVAAGLTAGRVLLGSAVGSPEQLTLNASLYAVPGGRELATASVSGRADELPRLIDRLTAEIVSLEAGESEERLEALTSASPQALRAYLEGMSYYRRGLYRDAAQSLALAVSHDSTFALAALYMSEANSMVLGGVPGAGGAEAIVRANRDRLGPRDRAFSFALYPDPGSGQTRLQRWEAAISALQDRPEAWYRFGDALFHNGAVWGIENFLARARDAFARAVALDSTYFTPLHHLVWIAEIEGDTAFAQRIMRRYLENEQTGGVAEEFRLSLAVLTRDTAAVRRLDAEVESLSDEGLVQRTFMPMGAFSLTILDVDRAERAAEILLRRAATPAARRIALDRQYYIAMNAGRPQAADAILDELESVASQAGLADRPRIHGAIYWDGDEAAAARAAQRVVERGSQAGEDVYALATWRLWRGETAGVPEAIAQLRRPTSIDPNDQLRAAILETWLADVRKDPRALTLALELETTLRTGAGTNEVRSHGNLNLARIFEARGDARRALAATRRVLWNLDGDRYSSTFLREEGRLAATLGEREAAVRAYTGYLRMRAHPEPELQPEVDRIRAELIALGGQPPSP